MKISTLFLLGALVITQIHGASKEERLEESGWIPEVFTEVDGIELKIWHKAPPESLDDGPAPAIVFFYGGGWNSRNISQFQNQGEHLANQGMHAFLADYRVKNDYGGTPFDCVEDAKSAMRYVRYHAERFGIDPNKIAASGGSAGGHLAAACALLPSMNSPSDPDVSCKPDALVLFNPVYDNSPDGFANHRVKERWREFSPMHHIDQDAPPNIVFLGTKDHLIPVETAEAWQAEMLSAGVYSELHLYPDRKHAFFNKGEDYTDTVEKMDEFLKSFGYLHSDNQSSK
ncbi:MAG: alpha/beta hydrolase [Puniceicoccales bacterium]